MCSYLKKNKKWLKTLMLLLVLFTLKSIIELYLIQMYIIKIYIVIYLPYFWKKKYQMLSLVDPDVQHQREDEQRTGIRDQNGVSHHLRRSGTGRERKIVPNCLDIHVNWKWKYEMRKPNEKICRKESKICVDWFLFKKIPR